MISLSIVVVILLVIIAAIRPIATRTTSFELSRLEKLGRISALELGRRRHETSIISIRHIVSTTLLVVLVPIAISAFGWLWGVVASIIVALVYEKIASTRPIMFVAGKLYGYIERPLINFCERFDKGLSLLRVSHTSLANDRLTISSKDELLDALKRPPASISNFELMLLKSALKFEDKLVGDIMTPRSVIQSVHHDELLGPILLSELHQTGHSRFPVTAGDIDHVVGVLYVRDLLTIDGSKNSKKVSQVMDEEVCFIREDQNLAHALKAFIKTEKLLFIVINKYRETVGVLTLEDVIETLIGQKINDEFEHHTDLRAVAEQNISANNSPKAAKDV